MCPKDAEPTRDICTSVFTDVLFVIVSGVSLEVHLGNLVNGQLKCGMYTVGLYSGSRENKEVMKISVKWMELGV